MSARDLLDISDGAIAKAREMVETMRKKGDEDGAELWLRIIVAIGTLGQPPTVARHLESRRPYR
jgi:hypothetical protein